MSNEVFSLLIGQRTERNDVIISLDSGVDVVCPRNNTNGSVNEIQDSLKKVLNNRDDSKVNSSPIFWIASNEKYLPYFNKIGERNIVFINVAKQKNNRLKHLDESKFDLHFTGYSIEKVQQFAKKELPDTKVLKFIIRASSILYPGTDRINWLNIDSVETLWLYRAGVTLLKEKEIPEKTFIFSIYTNMEKHGTVSITDIDYSNRRGVAHVEMESKSNNRPMIAYHAVLMLNDFAFNNLEFNELCARVTPEDATAYHFSLQQGYVVDETNTDIMRLDRKEHYNSSYKLRKLLRIGMRH